LLFCPKGDVLFSREAFPEKLIDAFKRKPYNYRGGRQLSLLPAAAKFALKSVGRHRNPPTIGKKR
jgi:hypothetical protein